MTDKTTKLFSHLSTSSDFLLSKADASCLGTATSLDTGRTGSAEPSKTLLEVFPDLTVGRRFLELATSVLEEIDTFCACAVRIVSTDGAVEGEDASPKTLSAAKAIDLACQKENGLWGMIDQDLFGCYFPNKTEAFSEKASALIRKGMPRKDRSSVLIGTAVYPDFYFEKNQTLENACKAVDHACFYGPGSTVAFDDTSLNISGDKLFQHGDIEAAVAEYKKALEMNDRNINIRNSLGVCYGLLGRLDMAKQEFAAAVCCDGQEVISLYNLGLIHMLLEERSKALEYFKKAQTVGDDLFEVTYQTGRILLEMGDTDACLPYLNRAIQLDPSSAQAFRSLGDCYVVVERLSDAVGVYKKAIKLNPNEAAALSALGALYDIREENTEIATLYCEKSVQLSPKEGLFHLRLGKLYLKQDRVNEAEHAFKIASDLGQNTQEVMPEAARTQKTG